MKPVNEYEYIEWDKITTRNKLYFKFIYGVSPHFTNSVTNSVSLSFILIELTVSYGSRTNVVVFSGMHYIWIISLFKEKINISCILTLIGDWECHYSQVRLLSSYINYNWRLKASRLIVLSFWQNNICKLSL